MLTWTYSGLDTIQKTVTHWADPLPSAAHQEAGAVVQTVWQAVATGAVIPPLDVPYVNWGLAASVTVQEDGEGATVTADAAQMPKGAPSWNMKPMLLGGPKARHGAHSIYNIIPMRTAAAQVPSAVLGEIVLHSVNQAIGGPRRTKQTPVGAYTWTHGLYQGMRIGMHPDLPVGPVTFRTVSSNSPAASWWYPAKPALPLLEAVWTGAAGLVARVYAGAWEDRL